jgi:hypothetical protein
VIKKFDNSEQPVTMEDAVAAGDGTLHGAVDYWQERALRAEVAVPEGYVVVPLKVTKAMAKVYRNEKGAYQTAQQLHDALIATVPPAPAAVPVGLLVVPDMPSTCKHCGGDAFEWFPHNRVASDVTDGRLRSHDVACNFVLGCMDCSETLMVVAADKIASMLTTHPQPAAKETT